MQSDKAPNPNALRSASHLSNRNSSTSTPLENQAMVIIMIKRMIALTERQTEYDPSRIGLARRQIVERSAPAFRSSDRPSPNQHAARQIARAVGSGIRLQSISQIPDGAIPVTILVGVAVL
jgi:hypothetical protein